MPVLGWACVLAVLAGAVTAGALIGPVTLPPGAILQEVLGRLPFVHVRSGLSPAQAAILWQIRLPRVVLGLLVGSMLSLAGSAYQGVFRNPLADPYLLGAAAGAGLGATLVITFGIQGGIGPVGPVQAAAFAGALVAVAATWLLGRGLGPGDRGSAHAQAAGTERSASTIFDSRSVTRGPHREAMSSSRATTRPFFTAAIVEYPGRADTVAALWPQHLVSARKMRSGLLDSSVSALSWG